MTRWLVRALLALLTTAALAPDANAQTTPQGPNEWLGDASDQACRLPLSRQIQNGNVGKDVAYGCMQDERCKTEISRR